MGYSPLLLLARGLLVVIIIRPVLTFLVPRSTLGWLQDMLLRFEIVLARLYSRAHLPVSRLSFTYTDQPAILSTSTLTNKFHTPMLTRSGHYSPWCIRFYVLFVSIIWYRDTRPLTLKSHPSPSYWHFQSSPSSPDLISCGNHYIQIRYSWD